MFWWNILARRALFLKYWNFYFSASFVFSSVILPDFQCINLKNSWRNISNFLKGYINYRKIPKKSPGAYIFQRPFLRGLYLEGLIYIWREICVSKSIGLVKSWKEIYVNNLQKVVAKTRLEDVDLSIFSCASQERVNYANNNILWRHIWLT